MDWLRHNGRKLYVTRLRGKQKRDLLKPKIRLYRWRICYACDGFFSADLDRMRDCDQCTRGFIKVARGPLGGLHNPYGGLREAYVMRLAAQHKIAYLGARPGYTIERYRGAGVEEVFVIDAAGLIVFDYESYY